MYNNDDNYVEEFIDMLKNSSAQKYYRANPYTKTDGVDYNGKVTEEIFFKHFYVDTAASKNSINDILYTFENNPQSTIIIKGYSGCGKTTFLHDFLYHNIESSFIIDCEKGIDNQDEDPILTKITFELMNSINDDIIYNDSCVLKKLREVFYYNYKNAMIIGRLLDGKLLTHTFLNNLFDNHTFDETLNRIISGDEIAKSDMARFVLSHLEVLHGIQRLFLLVAWDICCKLEKHNSNIGNVFCVDNLDNVESDKIKAFLKYFSQFWLNLINAFAEFDLSNWNINNENLVEKYAFILVLRETTYSKLTEHLSGREKGAVEEIDADELYSDCNVFENRSKFANEHKEKFPNELIDEIETIDELLNDRYIRKNVLTIFNNDNNNAIKTLCSIRSRRYFNQVLFKKYKEIKQKNLDDIRGAYGIILFMILDHFKRKLYFENNLMLYDFSMLTENQKYKYSATRLLLTYLSNCREPISMYQIFNDFNGVIRPEDIARIFYNIYQLRFSEWRHLITFTDVPPTDYKWIEVQKNLFERVQEINEERYSKVQITEAGKAYLRTIVPNFEFFSVRINNSSPLFYDSNYNQKTHLKNYPQIINRVYDSVSDCNKRIKASVEEICLIKGWNQQQYINSKMMYTNPTNGNKQFHGERVIFTHIGYLNAFRKHIIHSNELSEKERANHNKIIAEFIKKYLTLYESEDCIKSGSNKNVKTILLEQTQNVINNSSNFELPIELGNVEQ